MSEWISVNDRLPESGKPVLLYVLDIVLYAYQYQCVGFYAAKNSVEIESDGTYCDDIDSVYLCEGWYEVTYSTDNEENFIHGKVTHWMYLPEAPEDGGDRDNV